MTKQEAIEHFGSRAKMARALNIGKAAVSLWCGDIPLGRQCQIEIITDGALKADRDKLYPEKNQPA